MTRTITALFDTKDDAEAGKQRLKDANVNAEHIHIHDKTSEGHSDTSYSTHQNTGVWAKIKNAFLPDEDRHTYEEGIRRGGYVLTADVEENEADAAVAALEQANGVDIDQRASEWRSQGWNNPSTGVAGLGGAGLAGAGMAGGGAAGDRSGQAYADFGGGDRARTEAQAAGNRTAGEQVIPVVEEQLVVGKREIGRGGVRVRSYVTEVPVHEQVRLRQERINVERRPVDQPLSAAGVDGDAFRERTVEMTETNEEAVVGKTARVVEEVVVSKEAGERTETVDDTVRRTDVKVEDVTGGTRSTSDTAAGGVTGRDRI